MKIFLALILLSTTLAVSDVPAKKVLGDFEFTASFVDPWTPRDKQSIGDHGGMVIRAGGEDFWVAGQGITVTF